MPALFAAGAVLLAGCGGVASEATTQSSAVRVVRSTPQGTVQGYIEATLRLNGAAVCSVLDSSLKRAMVKFTVNGHLAAPGGSCAATLSKLATTLSSSRERTRRLSLPKFHAQIKGTTATVRYIGAFSHKHHTIALVKSGSGWSIDKIDGNG